MGILIVDDEKPILHCWTAPPGLTPASPSS